MRESIVSLNLGTHRFRDKLNAGGTMVVIGFDVNGPLLELLFAAGNGLRSRLFSRRLLKRVRLLLRSNLWQENRGDM